MVDDSPIPQNHNAHRNSNDSDNSNKQANQHCLTKMEDVEDDRYGAFEPEVDFNSKMR
jgi:hypothetical protein